MRIKIDKETEEKLKNDLEVVKGKIVKRTHYPIQPSVRNFLAENYLIPLDEDSIGGGGIDGHLIIDRLFERPTVKVTSKGKAYRTGTCLAREYEESKPDYWRIMKKHLKRFFYVRSWQREQARPERYDFGPWDHPRPEYYPTAKERVRVFDKACKVGKNRLSEREKLVLQIIFDESREESSETIYDVLSLVSYQVQILFQHPIGGAHPETNFRYVALFDADLREFWQQSGLAISENLRVFLGKSSFSYLWVTFYGKKFKIPRHSLFEGEEHSDYARFKDSLIKQVGVQRKWFETIEDTYIWTQFHDLVLTLSRIVRPIFLVAHFLEEEDPDIYDYHRMRTEFYLSSFRDMLTQPAKKVERTMNMLLSEVRELINKDFLFGAVWQDFLFDRKQYLRKPKMKKGRPLNLSNYVLVHAVVGRLKKHKAKLRDNEYKTAAKLINLLTREPRFDITGKTKHDYHNLGAKAVERIWREGQRRFGQ